MPPEMTLPEAMALADQDCPLPVLAGRALRRMRDRIRELEAAQPPVVDGAMVKSIAGHVRKWMGPIGSDLGAAHVATLHGAIVDGMSAALAAALRGSGVQAQQDEPAP